jgi:superfamily I DNA/RNA helicase
MEGVRRRLDAAGTGTWGDAVDRARTAVQTAVAGGAAPPYAHVVADEAQDFGPRDLRLIRALAPPGARDLFFAGDVGQRIYRWPFPWREAGVDVRGRGARLTVNYRTTAQIKRFADRLVPARLADVDEAEAVRGAVSLLAGPEPECLGGGGVEAEIAALAAWLRGLLDRGVAPHEIGLFARTARLLEERAEPACARAGLAHGRPARGALPRDSAVLATMHAAKGLEFRAVALVGCDADRLPHPRALAAADDAEGRRAAADRERCLFYVGCTRARDALLITWADAPTPFLADQQHSS